QLIVPQGDRVPLVILAAWIRDLVYEFGGVDLRARRAGICCLGRPSLRRDELALASGPLEHLDSALVVSRALCRNGSRRQDVALMSNGASRLDVVSPVTEGCYVESTHQIPRLLLMSSRVSRLYRPISF